MATHASDCHGYKGAFMFVHSAVDSRPAAYLSVLPSNSLICVTADSQPVQHMRQELLNTVKESSQLQQHIRRQADDIKALQRALFEERAKAKTALSMCNTAHCNHVRSLVARIESTVVPVSRLAASIQRSNAPFATVSPTLHPDVTLKRVLDSKEWTMEDWDSIEEAAICWLEELQSTVGACAEAVEGSQMQTPHLHAQVDTLAARLHLAEVAAAAAREGEAAATAREARAQDEAAAAAAALRSLHAVMDGSHAAQQRALAFTETMDGSVMREHVAAAEQRAADAEIARAEADARAAAMQEDMKEFQARCRAAEQQASVAGAGAFQTGQTGSLGGPKAVTATTLSHVEAPGCENPSTEVPQESKAPDEAVGAEGEADDSTAARDHDLGDSKSIDRSGSWHLLCDAVASDTPEEGGPPPDPVALRSPGVGIAGTAEVLAEYVDDVDVLAEVAQLQQALAECKQEEAAVMTKAMLASESVRAAVNLVQGACTHTCQHVGASSAAESNQQASSVVVGDDVQQDAVGASAWANVWSALQKLHAANENRGRLMGQLQMLQQARQHRQDEVSWAAHAAWKSVLHKLESDKAAAIQQLETAPAFHGGGSQVNGAVDEANPRIETAAQQRLAAVEAQLAAVQQECTSLQEAAATTATVLNDARAVEADLAEVQKQCSVLQRTAAAAESALAAAQMEVREKMEERAAAHRAADSATAAAAASVKSMGEVAARMQNDLERVTGEARQASAREQAAHVDAESARRQLQEASYRAAAAESKLFAVEEQLAEYQNRCSELSKACLVAELRVDDCDSAMLHVEEMRHNVLQAQQAAAQTVAALQQCSWKAAMTASRQASEAEATIADVGQLCTGRPDTLDVHKVVDTYGLSGTHVPTTQQLWLPALQEQIRGLRTVVDDWLKKLDSVEPTAEAAADRRLSTGIVQGTDDRVGTATPASLGLPEANGSVNIDVVRRCESREHDGQPRSTLDALLSSARELSMLETALQQPATTCNAQVLIVPARSGLKYSRNAFRTE